MGLIAPATSIAHRPHRVYPERPLAKVPDGEGGYRVDTWVPLDPPTMDVLIEPSGGPAEHVTSEGAMYATVTHSVHGPYHPSLTTECRLRYEDDGRTRYFRLVGLITPNERRREVVAFCAETVTAEVAA